jgi:uncharacterized protein (TIRG00374 family)
MKALLKLGVTIALVALILWQIGGVAPLVAAFSRVRPEYVLVLIVVVIADRALMALKWLVLLRPHGIEIGFGRTLTIYCVASFWGQVLPMTVGGDVVRLWLTTRQTGRFDTIAASIAMERLLGFVAALLATLVGLIIVGEIIRVDAELGTLWWAALAVVAAGIAAFWLSLSQRLFDAIYDAIPERLANTKLVRRVRELHRTYLSYRTHGSALRRFFYLTLLEQLMPIVFVWLVARALGIELSMLVAAGVVPLAALITRVPISLAGIGVYEGAFMLLLPLGGVSAADAVTMALLDRVVQILAVAPWWLGAALSSRKFTPPETERRSDPLP